MDEEKMERDLNEEPIQDETEGALEEIFDEDSFDEESYDEMEQEYNEESFEAKKKTSFWEDLSNKAVCKLLFLFAGIGFFFPFFTVACQGQETGLVTTGFDMFFKSTIPIEQGIEIPVAAQPLVIAAFAVIVLGLILTVLLKDMARNIAGAVSSILAAVIMLIFAIILPQTIIDTIKSFIISLQMGDPDQLGDLSIITPVFQAGYYFVVSLLVVNFIYFITQIAIEGKRKANEAMEFEGDILEDGDEFSYTDMEEEIGDMNLPIDETLENNTEETKEESEKN